MRRYVLFVDVQEKGVETDWEQVFKPYGDRIKVLEFANSRADVETTEDVVQDIERRWPEIIVTDPRSWSKGNGFKMERVVSDEGRDEPNVISISDKYFPKSVPVARRSSVPSPFAKQIFGYFTRPFRVDFHRTGTQYLALDVMESSESCTGKIELRFRLLQEASDIPLPRFGCVDESLVGTLGAVCYFSFDSALSLEENIQELRTFIAEFLEGELL